MDVMTDNASTPPPGAQETRMHIRFSSYRELLPGICQASAAFARGTAGGESAKLVMILRELLDNAIEYGSRNNPAHEIACTITRIAPDSVDVAVSDEGEGFQSESLDLRSLVAPTDSRRGGLRLVNALSDSIRFEDGGRTVVCRVSWKTGAETALHSTPQETARVRKEW